jgi:hypothetical protein
MAAPQEKAQPQLAYTPQQTYMVAQTRVSARRITKDRNNIRDYMQVNCGDVVRVVAASGNAIFFITPNGSRGTHGSADFAVARLAVVLSGPHAGKTVAIENYRRGSVYVWLDNVTVAMSLNDVQPLRIVPEHLPNIGMYSALYRLRELPDMPYCVWSPWQRMPHNHWVLAYLPPGRLIGAVRASSQVDFVLATLVSWVDASGRVQVSRKVIATFDNIDLSTPTFQFRMPNTAFASLSFTRWLDQTSRRSLISSRTVLAMSHHIHGASYITGRPIATLNSVGAVWPPWDVAATSTSCVIVPPLLSKTARASVIARLPASSRVNQMAPFSVELVFTSSAANLNDTIAFDSAKIQLFEEEVVGNNKQLIKLWSSSRPGFSATYDANDGAQRVAVCRLSNIVIPFLDACSGEVVCDDERTFAVRHCLGVKLYPGKFGRTTTLRVPCVLGQAAFDARDPSAPAPPLPQVLREWTLNYVEVAKAADEAALAANAADEDDNDRAAAAAAAAPAPLQAPPGVIDHRDSRRDHWVAPRARPPTRCTLAATATQSCCSSSRRCRATSAACVDTMWSTASCVASIARCEKFERHQVQLGEFQRLERLLTHVTIRVIDVETERAFVVEMAPMASRAGLVWRIEESQGRKVRRLTLLGSEVPEDAVMSGLVGLELEVELAPVDANVVCEHCQTVNEPGVTFCKNDDDCGRLLPSRLVRTRYEAHMELPECVICFETYAAGDEVTHLPCMHGFHAECVTDWLGRKTECPVCGSEVTKESISLA